MKSEKIDMLNNVLCQLGTLDIVGSRKIPSKILDQISGGGKTEGGHNQDTHGQDICHGDTHARGSEGGGVGYSRESICK